MLLRIGICLSVSLQCEWYRHVCVPIRRCLHTLVESRVDVFDQDEASLRCIGEQMNEFVVGEPTFREVQQT